MRSQRLRRATKQKEDEIEPERSAAKPLVQSSQSSARRATQSIEEQLVIETGRAVTAPSGPTIGPVIEPKPRIMGKQICGCSVDSDFIHLDGHHCADDAYFCCSDCWVDQAN